MSVKPPHRSCFLPSLMSNLQVICRKKEAWSRRKFINACSYIFRKSNTNLIARAVDYGENDQEPKRTFSSMWKPTTTTTTKVCLLEEGFCVELLRILRTSQAWSDLEVSLICPRGERLNPGTGGFLKKYLSK